MSTHYGAGKYFYKLAIALDQLFNVILCGWPDETLSSRAWRLSNPELTSHIKKRWTVSRKVIDIMFFWQKNHCKASYKAEQGRKHSPR